MHITRHNPMRPSLNISEFAAKRGVNRNTVAAWIRAGKVQATRPEGSRAWEIPESELERTQAEYQEILSSARLASGASRFTETVWGRMVVESRENMVSAAKLYVTKQDQQALGELENALREVKETQACERLVRRVQRMANDAWLVATQQINNPDETGEIVPDSETVADTLERYDREDAQVE